MAKLYLCNFPSALLEKISDALVHVPRAPRARKSQAWYLSGSIKISNWVMVYKFKDNNAQRYHKPRMGQNQCRSFDRC